MSLDASGLFGLLASVVAFVGVGRVVASITRRVLQVASAGDDLAGWAFLWQSWRQRKLDRANDTSRRSPVVSWAIGIGLFFIAYNVVKNPTTRGVTFDVFGLLLDGVLWVFTWLWTSWVQRLVLLGGAWYAWDCYAKERKKWLGRQPDTKTGRTRADMLALVREATVAAFAGDLRLKTAAGRTPTVRDVQFATFSINGNQMEFGYEIDIELRGTITQEKIAALSTGGLDAKADQLALAVRSEIVDRLGVTNEGRAVAKTDLAKFLPNTSAVLPVPTVHGEVDGGRVRFVLICRSPLQKTIRHPGPFKMRSMKSAVPVGFDLFGDLVSVVPHHTHMLFGGETNAGKSVFTRGIAATVGGLHPKHCPVALVAGDCKGAGGDLASLEARVAAGCMVVGPTETGYLLEALLIEGQYRNSLLRGAGKWEKHTIDFPYIEAFCDEIHLRSVVRFDTIGDPRLELEYATRAIWEIVSTLRSVGIHLRFTTQYIKAKQMDTTATVNFGLRAAARLSSFSAAQVMVPGSTVEFGPHRVPANLQGVMVGRFQSSDGLPPELRVMRSMMIETSESRRYAERQAEAGCTVDLPRVAASIEACRRRARDHAETEGRKVRAASERDPAGGVAFDELDGQARAAVTSLLDLLEPLSGHLPADLEGVGERMPWRATGRAERSDVLSWLREAGMAMNRARQEAFGDHEQQDAAITRAADLTAIVRRAMIS